MNTVQLGTIYENHVLKLLEPYYDNIWLTKNVPPDIIKLCKFTKYTDTITCDFGFDILAIKNEAYYFIQCKNFLKSNICIDSLSGFFHFVACYSRNINFKFVVYYNGKISHKIDKNAYIDYINIPFNNNVVEENIIAQSVYAPKCYQLEAYSVLKNNNIGILVMPCGMGKTYISYLLSQDYDNVIIISPLRAHAQQTYNAYKSYYAQNDVKYFLISMDGLRYAPELGNKNIVCTTFNSCDIVNNIIKSMDNPFIIVDEYHNLSNDDINGETELGKLLHTKNAKILFMSATPKNFTHIMFNEAVTYEYKWKDAIDNGYLSDYVVYCTPDDIIAKNGIDSKIIKLVDDYLKAYNILYGLKQNGHTKCIIYVNTIIECSIMVKAIGLVNVYLKLNINIGIINASISKENRKKVLAAFLDNTKTQIICNVHILDEAIDIPECDSVYIISESQNIIKIIQRACRCNRKIGNKISGIYIWSTKGKQIKDIIINTFNDGNKFVEMVYIIPTEYVQKITKIISKEQEIYDKPKNAEELSFSYEKCNKTFNGKQNLLCHIKKNVCGEKIKKVFKCGKCDKTFVENKSLKYHSERNVCVNSAKIYECENCFKSFSHYSTLWAHKKKCQIIADPEAKLASKIKEIEHKMKLEVERMQAMMDKMRSELESNIVNDNVKFLNKSLKKCQIK